MKKEDLLLVFDFLATALKQDVDEKQLEPVREIYEDYDYVGNVLNTKVEPEDKGGYHKTEPITEKVQELVEETKTSTEVLPNDNKIVKVIKTEAVRIKEIMDMIDDGKVFPYKKAKTPEIVIEKVLKEHQQNVANLINSLEMKVRDSLATPEQRNHFKEFVKMESFKTVQDLNRIEYYLNNPDLDNPYEGIGETKNLDKLVDDTEKNKEILDKSKLPQEIKDIMAKAIDDKPPIRRRFYDGSNGTMLYE
jgi:hypothetical protein